MKESRQIEEIDAHFRSGRRKGFVATAYGVLAAVVLSWLLAPNVGPTTNIEGVALDLVGRPTQQGETLYLLVRLESGKEVLAKIPRSAQYRKDAEVKLLKQEPLSFGKASYSFSEYVKEGA